MLIEDPCFESYYLYYSNIKSYLELVQIESVFWANKEFKQLSKYADCIRRWWTIAKYLLDSIGLMFRLYIVTKYIC